MQERPLFPGSLRTCIKNSISDEEVRRRGDISRFVNEQSAKYEADAGGFVEVIEREFLGALRRNVLRKVVKNALVRNLNYFSFFLSWNNGNSLDRLCFKYSSRFVDLVFENDTNSIFQKNSLSNYYKLLEIDNRITIF